MSSHAALLVQSVTNRPGIIGQLTGITGVAGTSGETATIACLRGCKSQAVRRIAIGSHVHVGDRLTLSPPILLSPATQIQVRLTATGRPTWSARYAFSLIGSKLRVRRI